MQLFYVTTDLLLLQCHTRLSCLKQMKTSVKTFFDNHFHALNASMELAEVRLGLGLGLLGLGLGFRV